MPSLSHTHYRLMPRPNHSTQMISLSSKVPNNSTSGLARWAKENLLLFSFFISLLVSFMFFIPLPGPEGCQRHLLLKVQFRQLRARRALSLLVFCWEPKGRYCHRLCTAIAPFWFSTKHLSILIGPCQYWEPEGRYRHRLSTAIVPFWVSKEHLWILIGPFQLSTDNCFT